MIALMSKLKFLQSDLTKNLKLFGEILGAKLRKQVSIAILCVLVVAFFDFFILSLIYQFVNALLVKGSSLGSNLGRFQRIADLNPTLFLPIIALILGTKSLGQYWISIKINSQIAARESSMSATFFAATLREKIDARKNRESVESLFLIDSYIVKVFGLVRTFPYFISDAATGLVIFLGLIYYSPRDSLFLILVLIVVSLFVFSIYSRKQRELSKKLIEYERDINTLKIESQRLAIELLLGNRIEETSRDLNLFQLMYKTIMGKITILGQVPKYILEFSLLLALSFLYFFNHSEYFLSTLALLAAAAFRVVPLIGSFVSNGINISNGFVTLNRLAQIVPTLKELDLGLEDISVNKPRRFFFGDLRVNNVQFSYGSLEQTLFQDLNLTFPSKTTTLLTGPSGIGKTSLLHLILGLLVPTRGEICILDGSDEIKMNESITGVSFLQQSVPLISGTVAQNIAGSTLRDFSDEQISRTIIAAGLVDTVSSLKLGINTHVGEDAGLFSAGERQRLGLARAMYGKPGLLILDEPTSNLDAETEAGIWETLAALRGEMTIIIVSHRGVPKDVYDQELIFAKQGNLTVVS